MDLDPDTIGKAADATAEVAKAGGKAIDVFAGIGKFFERVFGDLVVDSVGLVGDRLRYYRLEQAALLATKTRDRLEAKNITVIRTLELKTALPLIEFAAIEEDDDLHSRWANLLANGLDPEAEKIERSFVSLLAELSSADAILLDEIYKDGVEISLVDERQEINSAQHLIYGNSYKKILEDSKVEIHNLENLLRLGLISQGFVIKNCRIGGTSEDPGVFIKNLDRYFDASSPFFDTSMFHNSEFGIEDVHYFGLSLVGHSDLGRRFHKAIAKFASSN